MPVQIRAHIGDINLIRRDFEQFTLIFIWLIQQLVYKEAHIALPEVERHYTSLSTSRYTHRLSMAIEIKWRCKKLARAISSAIYNFIATFSHCVIFTSRSSTLLFTLVWNYFSLVRNVIIQDERNQAWLGNGKKYRCTPRSVRRFNNTRLSRCTSAISRRWICSHNRSLHPSALDVTARVGKSEADVWRRNTHSIVMIKWNFRKTQPAINANNFNERNFIRKKYFKK
jgi:hypothetical protein